MKYEGLIEDIQARGWKVDPLLVLTTRGSTHKTTISALKNLYKIPKTIIEPMVSQLNTNAIKYAMNILLYKRKLENNQPVPSIRNIGNKLKITTQPVHCVPVYLFLLLLILPLSSPPYPSPPFL
jgi:hypothetical protein